MQRVGIDIGGTFTDIVVFDETTGQVRRSKTPSTPSAPEDGFIKALEKAEVAVDEVRALVHGTTIVTNLILERDGARVALITSHGFGDVLEIMRATRPLPYDLGWRKPTPLIPALHVLRDRRAHHGRRHRGAAARSGQCRLGRRPHPRRGCRRHRRQPDARLSRSQPRADGRDDHPREGAAPARLDLLGDLPRDPRI